MYPDRVLWEYTALCHYAWGRRGRDVSSRESLRLERTLRWGTRERFWLRE